MVITNVANAGGVWAKPLFSVRVRLGLCLVCVRSGLCWVCVGFVLGLC